MMISLHKTVVLPLGLLLTIALTSQAGKVKSWHHHRPGDQERAQRQGIVINSEGALGLSRRVKTLGKLDAMHVWGMAEDRHGNLYAATGDEGKLYRVSPEGKTSVVYQSEQSQILCVCADPKGEVIYAGTGPEARLIRVDAHGAKQVCTLEESYIWALAVDPSGKNLYAATGPHGRIYRITAQGKATVFYETRQDHVLSLAITAEGTVYAGTDKTGRIYRITPEGKGFLVHQTVQAEVRTLLLVDDVLYAGTSGTKKRAGETRSSETGSKATAQAEVTSDSRVRVAQAKDAEKLAEGKSASKSKEPVKGSPAPAPTPPATGENSVYRIAADGSVREVFRGKVLVLSLAFREGRLLIGTGMQGELYEVDERTRNKTALVQLEHGQISCLLPRKDGSLLLGAGDPGKIVVLEDRFVSQGSLISEVLDTKLTSRWGALRWTADTPPKTRIGVAVRSGNVSEPDETWSPWSVEQTNPDEATIQAPTGRYLQYRLTLQTENAQVSPWVRSLTLRYATSNQSPEVTKIEVPNLATLQLENSRKAKFKWTATDKNEDELRYQLLVKKEGWDQWVELEEDWEKTEYEWDTSTTPSGVYRLKVVASDHVEHPEPSALRGERISDPFIVCHTAPRVTLKASLAEGGRMTLEASAVSPYVRLVSASYAVNGKRWVNVFPTDGLFDSKRESFRFRSESLKPGAYVLVLKVQDAAGNVGLADAVFTVPTRPVARK